MMPIAEYLAEEERLKKEAEEKRARRAAAKAKREEKKAAEEAAAAAMEEAPTAEVTEVEGNTAEVKSENEGKKKKGGFFGLFRKK